MKPALLAIVCLVFVTGTASGGLTGGVTINVTDTSATTSGWVDCVDIFGSPCTVSGIWHWVGAHALDDGQGNINFYTHQIDQYSDRGIQDLIQIGVNPGYCYTGYLDMTGTSAWGASDSNSWRSGTICAPAPPPPPPDPIDNCDQSCWIYTPVLISLENKIEDDIDSFPLSGPKDPVAFDMACEGNAQEITWTKKHARVGFLALDRDNDGNITCGAELFGNYTPMASGQPAPANSNGFFALRGYDNPAVGGNGDGHIGPEDAIWPLLRIWIDENHDGISQADEIYRLQELGVVAIALNYAVTNERDRYGNLFRYKSTVTVSRDGRLQLVPTYDVIFQRVE